MKRYLQMMGDKVEGFYKCEFGYPVRHLMYEPDPDQPLTPIKGEVLYNGDWILGRWTLTGQVLVLQFDLKWCLVEIEEAEYKTLINQIHVGQLTLFES